MESSVNILMVDDYPANLVALRAVLSDPIYNLIEASSGAQALEILETTDIALVLLDVQMPEMDGYEVARKIRANPRTNDVPIIFITAVYREEPSVRKGYEVGGQDYVGKPFDPDVLKAKVGIYSKLFFKTSTLAQEAKRLMKSEEHYRLIVETACEIIATIDNGGTITSLNFAFERLTGLKSSEWVGKSFVPLIRPTELAHVLALFTPRDDTSTAELVETEICTAQEQWIPVEISVQPLMRDGVLVGTVGVMRDISTRSRRAV